MLLYLLTNGSKTILHLSYTAYTSIVGVNFNASDKLMHILTISTMELKRYDVKINLMKTLQLTEELSWKEKKRYV